MNQGRSSKTCLMGSCIDSDKDNKSGYGGGESSWSDRKCSHFQFKFCTCCPRQVKLPLEGSELLSSHLQWTGRSTVLPVRCWSWNVPLSRAVRPARPRPPVDTASRQNVSIQNDHILFFACRIGLFISQEIIFFLFQHTLYSSIRKSLLPSSSKEVESLQLLRDTLWLVCNMMKTEDSP